MGNSNSVVKILFLGQCLNYGYSGVSRNETFPHLSEAMLKTQFPRVEFKFDYKYFHHLKGLKALLKHRLSFTKPDIAVVSIPAMFAAAYWRVNLIYQFAPELMDTARSFLLRIQKNTSGRDGDCRPETLLDRTSAIHPPVTLEEYETVLEDAIKYCNMSNCRIVLMGPGRFNEDTIENYAIHSPDLWSSVNTMVQGLGDRWKLSFINAQETLSEYGGEVFIPENHRWSVFGHSIVAGEVRRVLANELKRLTSRS